MAREVAHRERTGSHGGGIGEFQEVVRGKEERVLSGTEIECLVFILRDSDSEAMETQCKRQMNQILC